MNWTLIICLLIIAGVILALSGQRLNPGRFLGNFFQAIISPAWNNKVFLGLGAAVVIVFFFAIYNGGGKPLGLTAMQKIASEPTPKTEMERFYTDSAQYFVTGSEKPSTTKPVESAKSTESSWNTWLFWVGLVIAAIIFGLFFTVWDEARDVWRWAMERAEQRRVVIDLRPPVVEQAPAQEQAPGQTNRPASSMWQKFKDHFPAILSATTLIEFVEELVRRVITDRLVRRRP